MGGCFPLFYYQYSTSDGGVQEKSPILRHQYEILNNPVFASALIPDKGISTLGNPILDSPATHF